MFYLFVNGWGNCRYVYRFELSRYLFGDTARVKCSVRKENNSRSATPCMTKHQPGLMRYLRETLAVHFIIQELALSERGNFAHPCICNVLIFSDVLGCFRVLPSTI